ncbi:MAG TPA: hypothetical protein VIU34_26655 [Steroidobacter sp.]
MDEYLFMTLAKLKADRLKLQREERAKAAGPEQLRLDMSEPIDTHRPSARRFSQQPLKEGIVMSTRTALSLAAALVINASALAAWEWNVNEQVTPAGEVTITQIEESAPVASLAQATVDGQVVRTANRSL